MKVQLMAHTQLSDKFRSELGLHNLRATDGQAVALTAIRTCYSPGKPSEIVANEGARYFGKAASDGEGGTDADRLIRHIMRSKHLSTVEHLTFTFTVEGVSRALLAQLTRHRVGFSFSVQSQRYVRMGSGDKSGGFDYVTPATITDEKVAPSNDFGPAYVERTATEYFEDAMHDAQHAYDRLRRAGVPPEDARAVLPQAAACSLVMTANLRALLDFYGKRRKGRGAQAEITDLAEELRKEVVAVEPWTDQFFEEA
ncbi:thymidylate synthase ThyX [Geomicrobium sp. JCM 19037]|uniref:FAD-dependent thymidylate synthase n=1 Tax=Geomicrobium sp. JCM 19037 TaxID=1460634 RepID=UPI00045F3E12|nr:FAD-dependent thymidylate synthase [Geomicrobium sp. JCM 19037]GAK03284.1 thymidylate synthase ThyX [Geomicrobium sp. JCM 19037]